MNEFKRYRKALGTLLVAVFGLVANYTHAQNYEEVIHYHNDALGSPVLATDASGSLMWEEAYAPYGGRLTHESREVTCSGGDCYPVESTWDEKQWFTGKYEETRLGLQYFGARWYDPELGRFLSVDPEPFQVGNIYSFNAYAYGNNNPYKYVDPDGRIPVLAILLYTYLAAETVSTGYDLYDAGRTLADSDAGAGDKVLAVATVGAGLYLPGPGRMYREGAETVVDVTKGGGKADDVIHVTSDGVAVPADSKYKIPDDYVQNPHRSGNYGEIVDGKFKERLRIDPPTPPGQKGPNYSHYHKNGKGKHYSPREGDPDPGFQ